MRRAKGLRVLIDRQDRMKWRRGSTVGSRGIPPVWTSREHRAGEESNQQHAAAAARAQVDGLGGDWFEGLEVVDRGRRVEGCGNGQQLTAEGEFGGAMAVGEIAVMTNAVETVGEDMEEEAADELLGRKGHHLALAGMAIVLPAEADAAAFERDKPAVGDRDAVGVASEIGKDLFGASERGFGINDPCGAAQRGQVAGESGGRVERGKIAKEAELAGIESGLKTLQEQSAEELSKDRHGQEKAGTASHPAAAIGRGPAARDDAV